MERAVFLCRRGQASLAKARSKRTLMEGREAAQGLRAIDDKMGCKCGIRIVDLQLTIGGDIGGPLRDNGKQGTCTQCPNIENIGVPAEIVDARGARTRSPKKDTRAM